MGKQVIVYVLGMSLLLGFAVTNLNKTGLSSNDLLSIYYAKSTARNIALSGANIITQLCLADTTYRTNLMNQNFSGGTFDATITPMGDSLKIRSVSHVPIRYYDNANSTWRTEASDTVEAILSRLYFSEFGYFSESETFGYLSPTSNTIANITTPVYKITGDSIFGPAHTNGRWNFSGSPYFRDFVTGGSTPNYSGSTRPIFAKGSKWGVTYTRPTVRLDDMENAAASGGKLWTSSATGGQDLGLQFSSNGQVRVKIPWNTGSIKDTTYASLSSLAPNGVIGVKGIDVRVSGTYSGRATVFARSTPTAALKGNVWLQGNLVAANSPRTNPASTDMMGIVAERMCYIATTGFSRNASSEVYVDAAIYCQNGVLGVENYNTIAPSGRFNLYGGVAIKSATVFGTFSGNTLLSGMIRSIRFDKRFSAMSPPAFPFANKMRLKSWWQN